MPLEGANLSSLEPVAPVATAFGSVKKQASPEGQERRHDKSRRNPPDETFGEPAEPASPEPEHRIDSLA